MIRIEVSPKLTKMR